MDIITMKSFTCHSPREYPDIPLLTVQIHSCSQATDVSPFTAAELSVRNPHPGIQSLISQTAPDLVKTPLPPLLQPRITTAHCRAH